MRAIVTGLIGVVIGVAAVTGLSGPILGLFLNGLAFEVYRQPEVQQVLPNMGPLDCFVQKITESGDFIFEARGRPRGSTRWMKIGGADQGQAERAAHCDRANHVFCGRGIRRDQHNRRHASGAGQESPLIYARGAGWSKQGWPADMSAI